MIAIKPAVGLLSLRFSLLKPDVVLLLLRFTLLKPTVDLLLLGLILLEPPSGLLLHRGLSRINYIECNQKELWAELYSGAKDAMKKDGICLQGIGKKVVLPSSFAGGDRYMHQQYLDSIAFYQRFGRRHVFITMSTNPNPVEIQDNLVNGESPLDRPDLVARVFKLKRQ